MSHRLLAQGGASFSNHATVSDSATITGAKSWVTVPIESVFIPVKEMLANAPGFRSLYAQREIHFEEIYSDILDRAYRPIPRGAPGSERKRLLDMLQKTMAGKVAVKDEEFFLRNKQGNLEFTLLAEGMRKLGLLWLLIQNGTLFKGSVLFWDEPETNLNPKLFGPLIDILASGMRVISPTSSAPTLNSTGRLSHRLLAQGDTPASYRNKRSEQPDAPADRRAQFVKKFMCTAPGFLDTRLRYAAWRSSYCSRASSGVRYASFSRRQHGL